MQAELMEAQFPGHQEQWLQNTLRYGRGFLIQRGNEILYARKGRPVLINVGQSGRTVRRFGRI